MKRLWIHAIASVALLAAFTGPAIAGGMLYVGSGYAANGIPGNVLLAFSVDGQ
jgi:hypothetical protein